ncbi:hypothetical protein BSKO_12767 [Bryopsis sp. KO-2023]|nr:hypothetical protein BSKO_12767 [Bryopsis sp. KO-2023]
MADCGEGASPRSECVEMAAGENAAGVGSAEKSGQGAEVRNAENDGGQSRMQGEEVEVTNNTKKRRWRGAAGPSQETPDASSPVEASNRGPMGDQKEVNALVYGAQATASVELQNISVPIRFGDVNKLALWTLTTTGAPTCWAQVKKMPLIQKFLVVYVSGIDRALWESKKEHMPNLASMFGTPLTTVASSAVQTPLKGASVLLSVVVPKKEIRLHQFQAQKRRKLVAPPPGPKHYLLSESIMRKYDFPLHTGLDEQGEKICPAGYVETKPAGEGAVVEKMVAVDCEMCDSANGKELTRMSLVDENGKVLVDELVKPENTITDYLTPYSGITAEMLKNVKTTLRDAQEMFLKHVSRETLLVGHSVENDLKAMQILHFKILDTVVMYPHPKGFPSRSSLKMLSDKYLHRKIQNGAHDSVVDALAALDLVKMKIKLGPDFANGDSKKLTHNKKLVEVLHEQQVRCCLIDRKHVLATHSFPAADEVSIDTDESAEKAVIKMVQMSSKAKFVWTQMQDLGRFYFQRAKVQNGLLDLDAAEFSEERLIDKLKMVDQRIGNIFQSSPPNTLAVVVTGQGDTMGAMAKQEDKFKRLQGLGPTWGPQDEQDWNILSQKVIQGLCFVKVKGST